MYPYNKTTQARILVFPPYRQTKAMRVAPTFEVRPPVSGNGLARLGDTGRSGAEDRHFVNAGRADRLIRGSLKQHPVRVVEVATDHNVHAGYGRTAASPASGRSDIFFRDKQRLSRLMRQVDHVIAEYKSVAVGFSHRVLEEIHQISEPGNQYAADEIVDERADLASQGVE